MQKKLLILLSFAALLLSGCVATYLRDRRFAEDGKPTHEVTFWRGGLFNATTVGNAEIDYNGVTARVGSYSSKGDAAMAEAIARGIAYAVAASASGGAAPAAGAILSAMLGAGTNALEVAK